MLGLNWIGLIALTLFAADLCNGRAAYFSSAYLEKRQSLGGSTSNCKFASCSPEQCSGSVCLRSGASKLASVNHLSRRAFPNPTDIGEYIDSQALRDDADKLCPVQAGGFNNPSFCVQHRLADLPHDKTSVIGMGNTQLTGCTILAVISARAVYMCHFWEDIHFADVNTVRGPRPKYGIQPVLNLISGQPNNVPADTAGPALDPTLFNGGAQDNTYAFVMTPRNRLTNNDPQSQEHGPEIQQVIATVRHLVPGVAVEVYNYATPPGGNGDYPNNYDGSAMWEYDPTALGAGKPDWRLWFEATNERGRKLGQGVV